MTIREKMQFIQDNEQPQSLKLAREVIRCQWDIIMELMDQKQETFKAYASLEDQYIKLKDCLHTHIAEGHRPDKLPN